MLQLDGAAHAIGRPCGAERMWHARSSCGMRGRQTPASVVLGRHVVTLEALRIVRQPTVTDDGIGQVLVHGDVEGDGVAGVVEEVEGVPVETVAIVEDVEGDPVDTVAAVEDVEGVSVVDDVEGAGVDDEGTGVEGVVEDDEGAGVGSEPSIMQH